MRPVCARFPLGDALAKAGLKAIDRDRAVVVKQRKALSGVVAAFLESIAPKIAAALLALLGLEKARRKAGGDPEALAAAGRRAREALDALDMREEWRTLVNLVEVPLTDMAQDGALSALEQLLVSGQDITVLAGDKATAWAQARAAEMVGMKRNAMGELVSNPNAKWRIDDSTRDMLRTTVEKALAEGQSADEVASAIMDSTAFSAERAEMIARTEIAKADMAGTMEGYRASGLVAGKTWSTSQDDLVSDECIECEAAGVVGMDAAFPSGVDAPPNHPNCRCTVLPVLTDEMPAGKNLKDTNMTKLYAAIEKAEKQDDGTIKVYGFASSEVVDSDGETVTADAMKAAREGYMAWGAVREMHDAKKAAGVAIEYDVQEDGRTWFGAHVVDPVAVLKVETGVYKGFSIGAKVPKGGRDGKVIKSIDLREVSLVDRPANPEAVFTLCKAEGGADEASHEGTEDLRKGMYELSDFAGVLRSIGYLVSSAGWEAQSEGDNSPLPKALLDWLATGIAIYKAMAVEETTELLAQLKAAVPASVVVDTITAADGGGDLAKAAQQENTDLRDALGAKDGEPLLARVEYLTKAGKKFSAATAAALAEVHKAMNAVHASAGSACEKMASLAYDAPDTEDDAGKAAKAEDLQKAAAAEAEQVGEIAKAAGLTLAEQTPHALAKAALTELVTLRKSHSELLARPAPAKGVRMVVVEKVADRSGQETNEPAPVVKADGAVDDVATLVKAAQARPIRLA